MTTEQQTAQHTPGPWRVLEQQYTSGAWGVVSDDRNWPNQHVANIHGEANARLIAAAPDLLAALSWGMSFLRQHRDYYEYEIDGETGAPTAVADDFMRGFAAAEAAIRTARGEELEYGSEVMD